MGETSVTSEIRRWKNDDITKDFFQRISNEIVNMDRDIHGLLLNGDNESLLKAAFMNARFQQLKEVFDIPQDMIDDSKGE